MNYIQSKWMATLLVILFICMVGQVVIHWNTNIKSVVFNGIGALCIGTALLIICKRKQI
ncbi:hypothetical protein [Ornithinibacillus halotolerans]|uniref:Uncharacterized protein n=1 Tax=Ornithinibacillus halotolerans TaxID=1274357 RepID=A0A916W419_9BACI|nr:hypothetical protein [Ornithinibacillus halotolerans]GGA64184.1 hypothetical protein GCM10008025_05010 [Ornithinibacillus halotolerans]